MSALGKFEEKRQFGIRSCVGHVEDFSLYSKRNRKYLITDITWKEVCGQK